MAARSMPNADAAWLHMDRPTNRMVINALLWFDEPVGVGDLRRVLGERIVGRFPSFRQRAVERGRLGGAAWEDDQDFDLDLHLHHLALPSPGDRRALQTLVGDLASTPLSRDKALWDAYLIDGYRSGSAVLLRTHHCIADWPWRRFCARSPTKRPHAEPARTIVRESGRSVCWVRWHRWDGRPGPSGAASPARAASCSPIRAA